MTVKQINYMKHSIGFSVDKIKRGKYKAYRNYFNNGPCKDEEWDLLVQNGYAKLNISDGGHYVYHVLPLGIELLGEIMEVKVSMN